jgi:hypothetical protein
MLVKYIQNNIMIKNIYNVPVKIISILKELIKYNLVVKVNIREMMMNELY